MLSFDTLMERLKKIQNSIGASWIIRIEFGKSRSVNYKSAVEIAKTLPFFSETDGKITCGAKSVGDYIVNKQAFENLMSCIHSWKTGNVLLYDRPYKYVEVYHDFHSQIAKDAGKYAPLTNNSSLITLELLPLPIVYYPGYSGCFFAFSEDIGERVFFCECERIAIEHYLNLRGKKPENARWGISYGEHPLEMTFFPETVARQSLERPFAPLSLFGFMENLCFRCNRRVPNLPYPSGSSKFAMRYGWYVKQKYFELGIDPRYVNPHISKEDKLQDENIENLVREEFGFRHKGEQWVSETTLYYIVKGLYPEHEVIMHYRPAWLEGLELDIFVPELSLAFEYQGIQHYEPVEHWGGIKHLKKQQEHDERKFRICTQRAITLVYIRYDEELTSEYVKGKIIQALSKPV